MKRLQLMLEASVADPAHELLAVDLDRRVAYSGWRAKLLVKLARWLNFAKEDYMNF